MCDTEQPKEQPQISDGGSNPVAINQFLIFLLYWVHMFSLSFFICQYSLFYVAYFISFKFYFEILPMSLLNFFFTENEAEII